MQDAKDIEQQLTAGLEHLASRAPAAPGAARIHRAIRRRNAKRFITAGVVVSTAISLLFLNRSQPPTLPTSPQLMAQMATTTSPVSKSSLMMDVSEISVQRGIRCDLPPIRAAAQSPVFSRGALSPGISVSSRF